MKAIEEIGIGKTIKFVIYNFLQVIYSFMFLPPARKLFLSLLGADIDGGSILMNIKFFNWQHKGPKGLKIGKDCFLGDDTLIDLYDGVILEDQVTLAQKVTVLTHLNVGYSDHPLQKAFPKMSKPVVFRNGCVVAAGAIILPGVTIGENSFVGAGSVVTKDVPPGCLYAGNPAKLLRKIK